jgi:RNA polymerase sigma-70 factor (sigma-E family)
MRPETQREYVEYLTGSLPRLHRTAYLLCGDRYRADDIVQATALALYVHWRRVRAADNVDGYVHRTLVRQYLNTQRLAWSRVLLTTRVPDSLAPPDSSVEERDALAGALAGLPPGQRTVLVLRYYCDLSVEDTALAMRCSTGNVKSQSARGLSALRAALGDPPAVGHGRGRGAGPPVGVGGPARHRPATDHQTPSTPRSRS